MLTATYERQPENFEDLLGLPGVGAKTVRALSLLGELMYGARPSFRDPARFSFAHGGKDGIPYPVDRKVYDQSIDLLARAIGRSKIDVSEREAGFPAVGRQFPTAGVTRRPGGAQSLAFSDRSVSSASATMRSINS